jgi:hypothetical protein
MSYKPIIVDDITLRLLPPTESRKPSQEEVEKETLKLLMVFVGIKQRVLRENKNRHQYVEPTPQQKVLT